MPEESTSHHVLPDLATITNIVSEMASLARARVQLQNGDTFSGTLIPKHDPLCNGATWPTWLSKQSRFNICFFRCTKGTVFCGTTTAREEILNDMIRRGKQLGVRGKGPHQLYKIGSRKQIMANAVAIFHHSVILGSRVHKVILLPPLTHLAQVFGEQLWHFVPGSVPWTNLPEEIYHAVTPHDLVTQYQHFQFLAKKVRLRRTYGITRRWGSSMS